MKFFFAAISIFVSANIGHASFSEPGLGFKACLDLIKNQVKLEFQNQSSHNWSQVHGENDFRPIQVKLHHKLNTVTRFDGVLHVSVSGWDPEELVYHTGFFSLEFEYPSDELECGDQEITFLNGNL